MSLGTQLNINIDSDLMKQIKKNAVQSEMSIGSYVNILLKCYLTNKDLEGHNEIKMERLDKIESKLILINNYLDKFKI
ncbi:Hypothetical protein NATL1_08831 [Prochlorococcus marinus str. NATL1A]|uniref:Uncharacterized protein n=1 Tax=Prochlorococcus marinus (strain NATL1A) TaxID=167555 RepID=A2C1T1_PROM1|nr:hypothetical protein [Prochlorococcus marinus]ABM75441.1 Hypothetical protein NATL1_08831 [Prochlorococcus marinus str. NATL1A]